MNLKEIKEIVDLITEKGISYFELERAGVRLKIHRNTVSPGSESRIPAAESQPALGASVPPAKPSAPSPVPLTPAAETPAGDVHTIRSPMVGTFYAAPTHAEGPFVQVGDKVQPGQVLCIIEAMKLMNEIEADMAGEILTCYVENGQPVEYGEPLFDIRPAVPAKRKS